MNKKISFPIAIIIVVVLALLVGGLVVWQYYGIPEEEEETPEELPTDETADWKTYRNEICKFEIKYPEKWLMREYSPGRQSHLQEEERTLIISFAANQEYLIEKKGVNIFTAPPGVLSSWQLYMQAENVICNNEELSVKNIQDLIQEGKVKDYCFTEKKLYLFTIFDTIFKFYIKEERSEETFNQILSTFRFLE